MTKTSKVNFKDMYSFDENEVHVWSASFSENYKNAESFSRILSKDELEKANSYKFEEGKKKYIISRGILRCLVGHYTGTTLSEIEIIYGLWGKPRLVDRIKLHFNLSHSNDIVLYAFSTNKEVGIDIEYIDSSFDVKATVSDIISSPQEEDYWNQVKEKEPVNSFFRLWVCKEAFLKMSGKGWLEEDLSLPNQVIEFLKNSENEAASNFYLFNPQPEYVSALFIEGNDKINPIYYKWNSQNQTKKTKA